MLPMNRELIINLMPGDAVKPQAFVSQKDAGSRTVKAILYHGSESVTGLTGVTASVSCVAPDGQQYTIPATITDGNPAFVEFTISADVTEVAGYVDCELVLVSGDVRIGSGNFWIIVEGEPGAIASTEYESIKAIKQATENAVNDLNSISSEFLNRVGAVEGAVAEVETEIDKTNDAIDLLALQAENYADDMEVTPDGLVYLLHQGERIGGPYGPFAGGGGGGGSGNNAVLTVTNTSGFVSTTIAKGDDCPLKITWTSIENEMPTGNGSARIQVNGIVKSVREVPQGDVIINAGTYLSAGANVVKITISDIYGNQRTISFNVTAVEISISSTFDDSIIFNGPISFSYTPVGSVAKTVYFKVDGTTVSTVNTSVSGRQLTQSIPRQAHGSHSIEVYFDCEINGNVVESNHLYYDIIAVEDGDSTPIIASSFHQTTVDQYTTLNIPYTVYTPSAMESAVTITANGTQVADITVDRTQQSLVYRADTVGALTIIIRSGSATKRFELTVAESSIDVHPATDQLKLYLTSQGRSNNESHPEVWESGEISATLTDFNFVSNGWIADADGITALRVSGDARVTIPYKIFEGDPRATGKTIEVEFATRDILDYDSTIISCFANGRGIQFTPQKVTMKSEQSELMAQYKEDEHVRISFVVEKRASNRLALTYINGVASGVIQYPDTDNFEQTTPVGISIGSNDCTVDIYCIRVYDTDLSRHEVLDNWIADTQVGHLMLERYLHNNVYDAYGNIVISKLPSDLPYMIIEAEQLPQYKGDKKTVSGSYTDPQSAANSFTFTGCQINVQGTSSAPYARKNYDMQFKNGFEMGAGHADNYALAPNIVPFNRFVLKADVASSEGANNVELVKLYCDSTPFKRAEQIANAKVRQGIYGFPIVVFWHDTKNDVTSFLGKYNFNLPKRAPGPYGYTGNMESWEFQNNTSNLMLFKTDYFDHTMIADPTTGERKEAWRYDYEARFPSDEWTNIAKLQELQTFIYSTYRAEATGETLPDPVTYGQGDDVVTYTTDTAEYRLAKFRNEFGKYAEVDSFIFYYIFTELFLMVDSRAKNLFIGFSGEQAEGTTAIDRRAVAEPYDMDTAIGTNNEGSLVFGYSLEDTDHVAGADVFNGQDSVLWNNIRDAFPSEIVQMYQTLRSDGIISFDTVEGRFEDHQSKWPEAVFNEDSWFKYIDPLISPDAGKDPTSVYLPMMQGSKAEQRKWWLYNRFRYMDSKWNAGDALSDVIQIRGYAKSNVTVTPYADIYPTVKYGSYLVSTRGEHGHDYTLVCPLDTLNDTEIYIYSASQLSHVGDLSGFKVGFADFSKATRLQELKLGDSTTGYDNPNLKDLTMGNNVLLKKADIRNCSALTKPVDMSGCKNLEEVYFDGTAVTGVTLPDGGNLKKVHLPGTVTNLTIKNQPGITEFVMPSYANISTLWLDNVGSAIDTEAILRAIPENSRVRLIGFYWEATDATEISALFDLLDSMTGLDQNGNNVPQAQVSGTIHTGSLTGAQIAEFNQRYQYVTVTADHTSAVLKYYNYDGTSLLNTETVLDGGNGTYAGTPTRASTAQYDYTFAGWSTEKNATSAQASATQNVTADRDVYAAYTATVRKYTVYFYNGSTLLQTVNNVPYGGSATYTGSTPVDPSGQGMPFEEWNPKPTNIVGNTSCYAQFQSPVEVAEITDTWDTILANIDNGTYKTKYKVGNYKPFEITSASVTWNCQIVAIDKDEDKNGNKVPLSFMLMDKCEWSCEMSGTASGISYSGDNWADSYARNYHLPKILLPKFSSAIQSRIVKVKKSYYDYSTSQTLEAFDKLWIPSLREIAMDLNKPETESTGVSYNVLFKNNASRVPASNDSYWTRTKYQNDSSFWAINGIAGNAITIPKSTSTNIRFGFCLGLEQETIEDDWATIIASTKDGTYSTKYSIGDTKMLDLGTEGKVLMQLVGIDADDKADGTGKAPTTWISKGLLNKYHQMNPAKVANTEGTGTLGGWEKCEMRTYLKETIKPLIPQTVRDAITPVTKYTYIFQASDETAVNNVASVDDVWIPSNLEVGWTGHETQGPYYNTVFPNNSSRIKKRNGSAGYWWLRTAHNTGNFRYVYNNGGRDSNNADNTSGIALGFCI